MDPAFLTIAELNRLYDQRELSPVEVTRSLLDRIAAHDGKLHSFIRVTPEVALAEAQAAERELVAGRRRGPLQGIPYALKDIVETAGIPTTGHSKLCQDHVPTADAHLVTLLKAGGAVLMGKLATWEFALGGRDMVLAELRVTGGRDAGGLDNVLQRVRDAVQWPAPAPSHQLALGGLCVGQRHLGCHPDKAVQFAVMGGDAVEQAPRHLDWRQFALVVEPAELGDGQKGGIHMAGLPL